MKHKDLRLEKLIAIVMGLGPFQRKSFHCITERAG